MRSVLHGLIQETMQQLIASDLPGPAVVVTEMEKQGRENEAASPPRNSASQSIPRCLPAPSRTPVRQRSHPETTSSPLPVPRPFPPERQSSDVPSRFLFGPAKPGKDGELRESPATALVGGQSPLPLLPTRSTPGVTVSDVVGNLDDLPACTWCGGKKWWRRKEDGLLICECYRVLLEQDAGSAREGLKAA